MAGGAAGPPEPASASLMKNFTASLMSVFVRSTTTARVIQASGPITAVSDMILMDVP